MRPGLRARSNSRGFVLVLVLAMLVILSILAASIAVTTQRMRDEQLQRQEELQAALDMASTRATLLYLLTSQRMTMGGLTVDDSIVLSEDQKLERMRGEMPLAILPVGNEIGLDGTTYKGIGDALFSLRDDRGLLAVNWASDIELERFVQNVGATDVPFVTLRNRLLDYQDADDLYRLNSIERDGYLKLGMSPPSNLPLVTPLELRRVYGWKEGLQSLDDTELLDAFTVRRTTLVNVNTASASVLQSLPGLDAPLAKRVIQAREVQPFTSVTSFQQLVGAPISADDEDVSLYPADSGTLRLWTPGVGSVQVLHWTLTPLDDGGKPWRDDYEFTVSQVTAPDGRAARSPEAALFAREVPVQE